MAYRPKGVMDIYEIVARWHAGYTISGISEALGFDRKTIRRYVREAQRCGVRRDRELPERDDLLSRLLPLVEKIEREMPASGQFDPHREEIIRLITRRVDPLKPKTAFEVVCARHGIEASYSSFKRFMRRIAPERFSPRTTCRLEVEPGQEIQIDYAKMGLLYDPLAGRRRVVNAFIATLSNSRYKYIEYVYSQDAGSFVASHVRMFATFGGVAQCLVIDNLKSGVLKPDLYDPVLNPLYREMATHYGTFIDTARVRRPTDKGKIERVVPLARELFRKLKTLHPNLDIVEANRHALTWCRFENGERIHGTTGEKPAEAFLTREQPQLKPLPDSPFELAMWKRVVVHPDQYIQFGRQTYSVGEQYVGGTFWARGTERLIQVFNDDYQLIKQHVRTRRKRTTDPDDFPEDRRLMLLDEPVVYLIRQAERIGPNLGAYVLRLLEPHAKINFRKVQGVLRLAAEHEREMVEAAAEYALSERLFRYDDFKLLLIEDEATQEPIHLSEATLELVRPADYFVHPPHIV